MAAAAAYGPAAVTTLRQVWRDLQSEAITVMNRVDNPHKRKAASSAELAAQPLLLGRAGRRKPAPT